MTSVVAHRGAHANVRENTLAAFVEAVSLGVAGVELDVRRTLDGALVVHHDATVEFLRISQSPARDLPGYVPHLDHVLSTCSDVMVNVEIKNSPDEPDYDSSGSLADAVVACVAASATRVVVSCFDLATCDEVRRRDESIDLAWLVHRGLGEELLETAHDHGCRALNPHVSMVSALSRAAQTRWAWRLTSGPSTRVATSSPWAASEWRA